MYQLSKNQRKATDVRQMSTQTRRAGMDKRVVLTLAVAAAGAVYMSRSLDQNPYHSKEKVVSVSEDMKKAASKASDRATGDGNPMVEEKVSSKETKPGLEKRLEGYAKDEVGDTSVLVKKDANKVEPAWDDEKKKDTVVASSVQETGSFWSNLWGKKTDKHVPELPKNTNTTFEKASTAHGNPMVYEKHSNAPTKPDWERKLEANAEYNVRDTSTLVGKDTEKVRGVWEEKAERDNGRTPRTEEQPNSFWSHLFGKAEKETQKVEKALEKDADKASGLWQDLKNKASDTQETLTDKASEWYDNASEAVYEASNKSKKETDQAAAGLEQVKRDAFNKASELKQEANHAFDSAHKNDKTWYQKETEDVKRRLGSIKAEANKNMEWASQKVQYGISEAKDEVNRVFNNQQTNKKSDMPGHILRGEKYAEEELGQLRPAFANTKLKPAAVVVQNAHGKEM